MIWRVYLLRDAAAGIETFDVLDGRLRPLRHGLLVQGAERESYVVYPWWRVYEYRRVDSA